MRNILLASLLIVVSALGTAAPVHASDFEDASDGAQYVGVTTDLADFTLDTSGAVTGLYIGAPTAAVPFPCFDSGAITFTDPIEVVNGVIGGTQPEREIIDEATGELRRFRLSGLVHRAGSSEEGIAKGSVSISALGPDVEGVICNPRSFGWVAVASTPDDVPLESASYMGSITSGPTFDGLRDGGTASFRVIGDGAAIAGLTLAPLQKCAATDLQDSAGLLLSGAVSFVETGAVSTAIPTVAKYRLAVTAERAVGAFFIDRGVRGCLPLGGFFVAKVASALHSPEAQPTAASVTAMGDIDGSGDAE